MKIIIQKIAIALVSKFLLEIVYVILETFSEMLMPLHSGHNIEILKNKIRFGYLEKALRGQPGFFMNEHKLISSAQASLKVELPMAQDPTIKSRLGDLWSIKYSGRDSWEAFHAICGVTFTMTRVASQLLATWALAHKSPLGLLFLAICSAKHLTSLLIGSANIIDGSRYFSHHEALVLESMVGYVVFCIEPAYSRMASMLSLAFDDRLREDRLSDGIGDFIESGIKSSTTFFLILQTNSRIRIREEQNNCWRQRHSKRQLTIVT